MSRPPVAVSCFEPEAWRNQAASVVAAGTITAGGDVLTKQLMGTERDWMTFLYSLSSSGIGLGDVLSIYRRAKDPSLTPASPEPAPRDLVSESLYWEDDSSLLRFGFWDGAARKWGAESEEFNVVRNNGILHGVSEEVP